MAKVTLGDQTLHFSQGTPLLEVVEAFGVEKALLAIVNGKLRELFAPLKGDCHVTPVGIESPDGQLALKRTACMLLFKAAREEGNLSLTLVDTLPEGLFFTLEEGEVGEEILERVSARMATYVSRRLPVQKKSFHMDEAMEIFKAEGMEDRIRLFRYRRVSSINLYCIEGTYDYFYGFMVPHTGLVGEFTLKCYAGGILLSLPGLYAREEISRGGKLLSARLQEKAWEERMGLRTIADLNDRICEREASPLILTCEAAFEARIAQTAEKIVDKGSVRFVMIAGPSSSGKTTFSHRLSIQLSALGKRPHPLALDNYFRNREDTPLDEHGEKDYECLGAIDVEQFNQDMDQLLAGKEVEIPTFNFVTGKREYKGDTLKLLPEDILVIEGIHGLNDGLSYTLPRESQYRIYISPLTSLLVDEHNLISSYDLRLLRRMVRDARTRGISAKETIRRWGSVRRGEEKFIFPFREEADLVFNSSLLYELSVLKVYAEPLLFGIDRGEEEFLEANRLLKFLDYILPLPADDIPVNSLLREFVGGSCFRV